MPDQINDRGTSPPAPIVPSPFGSSSRTSRVVRFGVIAVVLVGAVLLALRLARGNKTTENATANADADAPAAAGVQPVSLDERAKHRIGVTYAPVTFGVMASEIRTVAQVTYDETRVRSISPKIDGWVEQLFVNYTGQPVAVGQPLLTIYSPMLVTAQQELLLAGKLGRSVAEAEGDARRGVSELRQAARRRLQYWDISDAQIDLLEETGNVTRTMTLRSSVPGVVVLKNVLEGQRIMAGEALYQVADLSVVWLEGEVFEKDLSSIRLGQRVSAEFDALPGETRAGRIAYLYPTLNPDTRTARVRVAFSNPGLKLKPGMYGTIRVEGQTGKPGLLVPRSAVLETGERSLVFVRLKDGRLEPRAVTIGRSTDTQTQILGGLAVGDTVVKSATFLVDAESNLGSALGGMGSMPGMDMTPPAGRAKSSRPSQKPAAPATKQDKMPGMDSSGRKE